MNSTFVKVGVCFAGGCLGGVTMNVLNLIFGLVNVPAFAGIDIAQDANANALYSDLFWGGVWGLLFLIPILKDLPFVRGVVASAIPTLAQLFIFLPMVQGINFLETEFRLIFPVYVFLLNAVWGVTAALFIYYSHSKT